MPDRSNVLILGGGFAGWYAARRLASLLPATALITVVDRVGHMLYTPMLTEVGGGTVSPSAIAVRHRMEPARLHWVKADIQSIDAKKRAVTLTNGRVFTGEHLVIALGAVTSYHNISGAKENSIEFKTLAHANLARERVDDLVEKASSLPAGEARKSALTLLVAGGGYTGVETMAALYARFKEKAKGKGIRAEEIQAVLIEPTDRLMQEMPAPLGSYGKQKLQADGVRVMTGVGVTKVEDAGDAGARVTLSKGEELTAGLLIWDAGIEPSPMLKDAGVPLGKHHGVAVDAMLRVEGLDNVWAMGDCAEIPNEQTGSTYAPTAQNAVREGKQLAKNVALVMSGKQPEPFRYKMLGQLALISEHSAVANVLGVQLRGLLAWAMWWVIYIAKLPGMQNRLRVIRDRL